MLSSKQSVIISGVVVIIFTLLTACRSSSFSSGTSSPPTGSGQAPGATTSSAPNLKFTGAFPGFVLAPANCTPAADASRTITWSDDELWTDVSKTASKNTFVATLEVNISKYQGAQTYALIDLGASAPSTGAYAAISLRFGDDQRLYEPAHSGADTISIAADERSGTLTATLVNSADPTDSATITGSWTCVIVP